MNETYILDHIEELCRERNWTHYELAKQANVPQSTIVNLFARTNQPTIGTLEKLCAAFEITLSQFFNESNHINLTAEQEEILNLWDRLMRADKLVVRKIMIELNNREQT